MSKKEDVTGTVSVHNALWVEVIRAGGSSLIVFNFSAMFSHLKLSFGLLVKVLVFQLKCSPDWMDLVVSELSVMMVVSELSVDAVETWGLLLLCSLLHLLW